ncbi:hypothetical protein GQ55_5G459600 [Panicum hallii var. hallii]|uniref:Uncharacterized protein n=1 Tax=Panicum hallii var. hallii TaxID=1504633 RepID=A0A2T7DQF6_9POAL|nr:hypothetical protein GQ55_5G459600 [Panicum hallii var. hallii]
MTIISFNSAPQIQQQQQQLSLLSQASRGRVIYLVGTLCFSKAHHMTSLGTLSYAFSRSIKTMCKSFFSSLYLSINYRTKKIASMVDLPGMNPNWF